jgi:hypothetical protein
VTFIKIRSHRRKFSNSDGVEQKKIVLKRNFCFSLHTTGYFMNDNEFDGIENATYNTFPKLTWILVFLFKKHKT